MYATGFESGFRFSSPPFGTIMIPPRLLPLQLSVFLLVSTTTAQLPTLWKPYDAVTYFCERWYHQSVVKRDTLFIYGGIQTFNLPGAEQKNWTNSTLGHNPYLLQVDLRYQWDWKKNISYTATGTTADPSTGEEVRDAMHSGTMFHGRYNDTRVYIYGGSSFRGNDGFPNKKANFDYSEQHSLFSFDNNTWNSYGTQLLSPSYGAAAEAPDQGLAFYLNGRTDDGSAPSTSNDGDSQTLLDGMHVIDMLQQTEKTLSVTGLNDNQPRVGGALQYAPGLGTDGVLVGLGGRVFDGKPTVSPRDEGRLLGFDSVDVFDISSYLETSQSNGNGTWYSQRTSGSLPQPRIDFCTIITSASDNSSHNIWVYGGRDPNSINGPAFFDETYVLSLPSFHWIKIHQGNKPRWGHTCHLAGGNQMITVGGHNEFENTCDWHTTGVGVLDLYRGIWGSMFQARGNDKGLNFKIVNDIGGSSWGDAVKREPEKGWSSKELGNIMNKTRLYDNFSGTITVPGSEAPKEGLRIEAIVIGLASVGAIVFIGSVAYLTFLYCRYRRPGSPTASPKPHHLEEVEGFSKIELPDGEFRMYEANGIDGRHECPGTSARAEADSGNAVTYAAELPCTNFGMGGRWGVPVVRTRRPTLLGGGSESEDAQSWAAGDDQAVCFDMKGCSESIV